MFTQSLLESNNLDSFSILIFLWSGKGFEPFNLRETSAPYPLGHLTELVNSKYTSLPTAYPFAMPTIP